MKKLDELLLLLGGMTGLSFDDVMKEAAAGTEEERQQAQADNVAKMAEHMGRSRAA